MITQEVERDDGGVKPRPPPRLLFKRGGMVAGGREGCPLSVRERTIQMLLAVDLTGCRRPPLGDFESGVELPGAQVLLPPSFLVLAHHRRGHSFLAVFLN